MDNKTYSILFDGTLREGVDRQQAIAKLRQRLKLSQQQMLVLFSGKPKVIKRGLDRSTCKKYYALFSQAGAVLKVIPDRSEGTDNEVSAQLPPPERIDSLFRGRIQKIPPTWAYRAGLVTTALLVLLLPLIYLILTIAVFAIGGWYAVNGLSMIPHSLHVLFFGYAVPVVSAAVVALFMLKPLFARSLPKYHNYDLKPSREPLFFAYVHAIADRVGAPRPSAISIDNDVNAAAYFHDGLQGMRRGELALSIGIPLFAGMNTRQLTGVLAHEFGHFSQGAGMRATFIIRSVNLWFYRAVFENDSWDAKLEELSESEHDYVNILFSLVGWAVWLERGIMLLLLKSAEVLSHFMLRQMEFDADRYEAQVSGSKQFRDTAFRLRLLNHAFESVYRDLGETWNERRLLNDVPSMIAKRADELETELHDTIMQEMEQQQSEVFDTHPGDIERIHSAEALKAPGVFALQLSSRELLQHYDEYAQRVTEHWYRGELGIDLQENQLIDAEQMDAKVEEAQQRYQAFETFFNGTCDFHRTPRCPDPADFAALDEQQQRQELEQRVVKLRAMMPEIEDANMKYGELRDRGMQAFLAQTLKSIGVEPEAIVGSYESWDEVVEMQRKLESRLSKHEKLFYERIAIALAGHGDEQERDRLIQAQWRLATTDSLFDELDRSANMLYSLSRINQELQEPESEPLIPQHKIAFYRDNVTRLSDDLSEKLKQVPYPFQRAGKAVTLKDHILEDAAPATGIPEADAYNLAQTLLGGIVQFNYRLLNQLALITMEREKALGVSPIKVTLQ